MTAVFRIKSDGGQAVTASLRDLPARLDQVSKRVVAAVTDWAGEELADQVSGESQVPRAVLLRQSGKKGPRVFFRLPRQRGSARGSIWLGAKPVAAEYVGDAVQTDQGVRVGPHYLYGAFLARMPSGHVGVYQRKTALTRHSRGRPAHWKPNLPIVSSGVDLEADAAVTGISVEIPERLDRETDRELGRELGDG